MPKLLCKVSPTDNYASLSAIKNLLFSGQYGGVIAASWLVTDHQNLNAGLDEAGGFEFS